MDNWLMCATAVASALFLYVFYKVKQTYRYFEVRNVPYIKPKYWFGSDPDATFLRESLGVSWEKIYYQLEGHKVGGFFKVFTPKFMIRDPEYVHSVLISSFEHFVDRPFPIDEETNPLDGHLFFLKGNKWRYIRNKLSPIFSTGKLRYMFPGIEKCGEDILQCVDDVATGKDVDMHDLLARYSIDIIGSCVLGLETDALKNPDSKIRELGRDMVDLERHKLIRKIIHVIRVLIPELTEWLKLPTMPRSIVDFFSTTISNVMDSRRKNAIVRKDFIQLILQLKEKGSVEIDVNETDSQESEYSHTVTEKIDITDTLLIAQCFVFFAAGFETTSKTLRYTLYLLAEHPQIQDKVRKEVLEMKDKHGNIDFDALKEMKYLDHCISETMRLFPLLPMLDRECTKDFTFPDGTVIEKGSQVTIPIYAIQRDPKYYPEPLKFRPERFQEEPARGTYAPFGDGPRICIGRRFALVQMKILLAKLLASYKFDPSPLNVDIERIKNVPWSLLLHPTTGMYVRISKLNA